MRWIGNVRGQSFLSIFKNDSNSMRNGRVLEYAGEAGFLRCSLTYYLDEVTFSTNFDTSADRPSKRPIYNVKGVKASQSTS